MASVPETYADKGSSEKVAFFAVVAKGSLGTVGANQIIVFEDVITNVGNAYNVDHGLFTAPFKGLYQFSASIMAHHSQEVWTRFTLNNKPVSHIYARATDNRHAQGSQTIILELEKGDIVCVQNKKETKIYGDTYTTFTGCLL